MVTLLKSDKMFNKEKNKTKQNKTKRGKREGESLCNDDAR